LAPLHCVSDCTRYGYWLVVYWVHNTAIIKVESRSETHGLRAGSRVCSGDVYWSISVRLQDVVVHWGNRALLGRQPWTTFASVAGQCWLPCRYLVPVSHDCDSHQYETSMLAASCRSVPRPRGPILYCDAMLHKLTSGRITWVELIASDAFLSWKLCINRV